MKHLIITLYFLFSIATYAQKEITKTELNKSEFTSLIFTVDDLDELKTIDWDEIKDMFKDNKTSDTVVLGFRVKNKDKANEIAYKHSIEVKGKSKDVEKFIQLNKRYIKLLEKL